MRVGGPYKVEISYIGNQTKVFQDVTLRLGEVEDLSCKLQTDSKELQEVVVVASRIRNKGNKIIVQMREDENKTMDEVWSLFLTWQ